MPFLKDVWEIHAERKYLLQHTPFHKQLLLHNWNWPTFLMKTKFQFSIDCNFHSQWNRIFNLVQPGLTQAKKYFSSSESTCLENAAEANSPSTVSWHFCYESSHPFVKDLLCIINQKYFHEQICTLIPPCRRRISTLFIFSFFFLSIIEWFSHKQPKQLLMVHRCIQFIKAHLQI